jgi:hypothetical protein
MITCIQRSTERLIRSDRASRLRLGGLALLVSVMGVGSARAQDPRDAMVARAVNEFDATRRLELLTSALNPTAGPPRGAWPVAVQLLAQTLIEDGQDSLAGVWLRWAVRLSPDLQPDTVQFLPKVVVAYRSAREFVLSTRTPGDSAAATTWLWPAQETGERVGRLQVSTATLAAPVRVFVEGVGLIGPGGTAPVAPGSYAVNVSAAGYDSVRVMREVLPGVTTVLEFRARSALARVTDKQRMEQHTVQLQQRVEPQRKGGLPWWVKVGAGGGVVWAVLWNAWIKHTHM